MSQTRVLLADAEPQNLQWLNSALHERYHVGAVYDGAAALQALSNWNPSVIIVGSQLTDMTGIDLVTAIRAQLPEDPDVSLLYMSAGRGHPRPDPESVFYTFDRSLNVAELQRLVDSAAEAIAGFGFESKTMTSMQSVADAARMQAILEVSRKLAIQRDLKGAARIATDAILELIGADRAYCLYHDRESGALWVEGDEDHEGVAGRGLAGFAARTGLSVRAANVGDDSRYDSSIDDPPGKGDEQLLAQPVTDPNGEHHAVFVAVRDAKSRPFTDAEDEMLRSLAKRAGPLMQQLALQIKSAAVIEEEREQQLFRQEAMEARQTRQKQGDVIRVTPGWLHYSYWGLLVLLVAGVAYLVVGEINEYREGWAIVRMQGATEVRAHSAGTIAELRVVAGDPVRKGDVIATLYSKEEEAEVERLRKEFDAQTRAYLLNLGDERLANAAAQARTALERAKSRLDERSIRAPHAGIVSDLRTREGEPINPGNTVVSIVGKETDLYVMAFLPGAAAPLLKPGMPLRLSMAGHQGAYEDLVVATVGEQVLSPNDARRRLGSDRADQVPIRGSVVLVTARLPRDTFESDGREVRYHNGMEGKAEVRIRRTSIIKALIPALKQL